MKKLHRAVVGTVLTVAALCVSPVCAFETAWKGDVHAYGPIFNWSGQEVWLKAELGQQFDVHSYGPLKDWTGKDVWIKADPGIRGQVDSYGPIQDWTGQEVWIK